MKNKPSDSRNPSALPPRRADLRKMVKTGKGALLFPVPCCPMHKLSFAIASSTTTTQLSLLNAAKGRTRSQPPPQQQRRLLSRSRLVTNMDANQFRKYGHELIDWIADYHENLAKYPVTPGTLAQFVFNTVGCSVRGALLSLALLFSAVIFGNVIYLTRPSPLSCRD